MDPDKEPTLETYLNMPQRELSAYHKLCLPFRCSDDKLQHSGRMSML